MDPIQKDERINIKLGGYCLGYPDHEPDIVISAGIRKDLINRYFSGEYAICPQFLAELTVGWILTAIKDIAVPYLEKDGADLFRKLYDNFPVKQRDNQPPSVYCSLCSNADRHLQCKGLYKCLPKEAENQDGHSHTETHQQSHPSNSICRFRFCSISNPIAKDQDNASC